MTAWAEAGSSAAEASRSRGDAGRQRVALWLMLASGFAGLGYQLAWTQQCALWLGHEAAAVLAVVAAFFGGLALGALALAPRIERSAQPARAYALCEAAIAAWALLLLGLMAPASRVLLDFTGAQPSAPWQWAVAFVGCTLLLLPATLAMGATLPAMARVLASGLPATTGAGRARPLAALYAANTLGAVAGVLATAFWLVPAVGLSATVGVCAVLNLSCAVAAWWAFGRGDGAGSAAADRALPVPDARPAAAAPAGPSARAALWRLAATGALGIGFEVLVVRVLSQVAEDTVYTFALLLAVYLVGTALGAAWWAAARRRQAASPGAGPPPGSDAHSAGPASPTTAWLTLALAVACLAGCAALWGAEGLKAAWLSAWAAALGDGVSPASSMAGALGAEAWLALLAFGPATVAMGALFAQQMQDAALAGVGFGRALGVNTLGAAAAPLLFGVLLAPAVGPKAALLTVVAGYTLLALWPAPADGHAQPRAMARGRGQPVALAGAGLAALLLAVAALAPPLAFVDLPEGARLVSYRDGALGAVSVVEDAQGVARLRINNRQQEGSSATAHVDGRQALMPLLLHLAPRRALFLGLGSGVTAGTAAADPVLQVDAVELLPEVIDASAHFRRALPGGANDSPRLHLLAADARRFVRTSPQAYDVVVADNFHPARSGSGALYTVEHFAAVRARLAPGGLFCQWLPLHQLDLATLRSIVRSFQAVYPQGYALLASNSLATPVVGLVGQADDRQRLSPSALRQRQIDAARRVPLADYRLDDALAVTGSIVAGPTALRAFAGDAPLNTDDHPVVAYRAPRITYAPDASPTDRLMALLADWRARPSEVLDAATDHAMAQRLAAYWAARRAYLEAGRQVQPLADPAAMLAQVRAPLLAVLATSPDFQPAREPLERLAQALARRDPAAAQALLAELPPAPP